MIRSYLKMACRLLSKHKGFALINVLGLSTGLACCMVIMLYVASESTFDTHHLDRDRIYRVLEYRKVPIGEFIRVGISAMVATVVRQDFKDVEAVARVFKVRNVRVGVQDRYFFEDRTFYVDQELFDVLTIPFIHGNPDHALEDPYSVVITKRIAEKYFGDADEAVGKTLLIKDPTLERLYIEDKRPDYIVTGVVQNPPSNTHFHYDVLMSIKRFEGQGHWLMREWHGGSNHTYLKLAPNVSVENINRRIELIAYDYVSKELNAWGQTRRYFLQQLNDIHFRLEYSGVPIRDEFEPKGSQEYLSAYIIIALLILLIGCMNFINLSNTRAVLRIKEVGLRKVIGARRWQMIGQFLFESILITFLSMGLAWLMVRGLLILFNDFAGTTLAFKELFKPLLICAMGSFSVVVGVLAGLYPAFILTGFRPTNILRGSKGGTQGALALKILVVGQFAISIFLAIVTVTVFRQLGFMRGGKLGFEKAYKYVLPFRMDREERGDMEYIKAEFRMNPNILGATASSSVPGREMLENSLKWTDDKLVKPLRLNSISCDPDFIPEYGLAMLCGRAFDKALNDENDSFILNEAAVRYLGYASPEAALGDRLYSGHFGHWRTIVGVVRNFHYWGMQREVEPMFMFVMPSDLDMLTLTLDSRNLSHTLGFIESKWKTLYPEIPFEGFFLDDDFDRQYRKESQMGELLAILTGTGILVSCLGLFGLASFMARLRTKEVGVRKVLGASTTTLIALLSRRFAVLIFVGCILGIPASYLAGKEWLQNFAYRSSLDAMPYVLAIVIVFMISWITVVVQSWRTAKSNPIEALKYE